MRANQYAQVAHTVTSRSDVIKVSTLPITQFVRNSTIRGWIEEAIRDYSLQSVMDLNSYVDTLKH